jgi:hypothetical protein
MYEKLDHWNESPNACRAWLMADRNLKIIVPWSMAFSEFYDHLEFDEAMEYSINQEDPSKSHVRNKD